MICDVIQIILPRVIIGKILE